MRKRNSWAFGTTLVTTAALLTGWSAAATAAEINFEGIAPGTIVEEVSNGAGATGLKGGTIGVNGFNPRLTASDNAAVIFDSGNPPGIDYDLGTPNEDFGGPGIDDDGNPATGGNLGSPFQNDMPLGNVLIVNEHLSLIDRNGNGVIDGGDSPAALTDDADRFGQFLEFDFSTLKGKGLVTVTGITYMDVDEPEGESGAMLILMGPDISPAVSISLPPIGDNGVETIDDFAVEGVSHARVVMNGSGAIEALVIEEGDNEVCWETTGGFNNADVLSAEGKKTCTFGGNIGPPPSGAKEVNWHEGLLEGSKFHTNDIHVTSCESTGSTGPQQPGGKKGFDIDKLNFECTGKFNNEPGYTCRGFFFDGGEGGPNENNDPDAIQFIVEDSSGSEVARCDGDLHGGNVQLHPPVGNQK